MSWFDPKQFYRDGYPDGWLSGLTLEPKAYRRARELVAASGARRVLEIGPGDAPLIGGLPRRVFLDISAFFLQQLDGQAVVGDMLALPFRNRCFDLVVASDVITHVPPAKRAAALAEMARLTSTLLVFNTETVGAEASDDRDAAHTGSAVATAELVTALGELGFVVRETQMVNPFEADQPTRRTIVWASHDPAQPT